MKPLALFVVWTLVLVGATNAVGESWSTYLNGAGRIGSTSDSLPQQNSLAWEYTSPVPPELAWEGPRQEPIEGKEMRHRVAFDRVLHVVAAGNRAYFGSSVDHKVYCVDATTGAAVWTFFTDGPVRLVPTLDNGKLYFGSDDGHVYCLDAEDGSVVWKLRVGPSDERLLARGKMISRWPVRTGVLVDEGIAYFGAGVIPHETVYLCAANAETGQLVWKNDHISQDDAGRNPLSPQGYLLAGEELLIVPSGRSLPAAFDKRTGEQLYQRTHSWRTSAGGVVGGTRAVMADGQVYASGPHHYLALNEKTGSVGFAFIHGYQLALSGKQAFVATGEEIVSLDRLQHAAATVERQKHFLQQRAVSRDRSLSPAEARKKNDELTAKMKALTQVGSLWRTAATAQSALIATENVVVAGGQGHVVALDLKSGKEIWRHAVEGDAGGLAVAEGRLYVSTDAGKIYCFAKPSAGEPKRYPQLVDAPYAGDDKVSQQAAQQIIDACTPSGNQFCLIVGVNDGRLAYELARRSELRIYVVEPDRQKAERARAKLDQTGLHGSRITVLHIDPSRLPISNYFANIVTSESLLHGGGLPVDAAEIARCVKPLGGKLCLAVPGDAPSRQSGLTSNKIQQLALSIGAHIESELQPGQDPVLLVRGALPGAGNWSHQYGNAANTAMSSDYRVKGGLGVLWYGDPGPSKMINRHSAAAAPLSTNGRMFIQGTDTIMCYDAYNGVFLWEYVNPKALRTGVFNNEDASNLVASDDALFVAVENTCTMLDAATGQVKHVYQTPESSDGIPRAWGYVAYYDGMLVGTSTIRSELERALKRRGREVKNRTDGIFTIDIETGKQWIYRGDNIMHVTIALGDDRVFFIDSSISSQEREELLREDKTALKQLGPEAAKKKEAELKKLDVRKAVALDARTGKELWSKPVDVTDCSHVGIGGGQLTLMYHNGHVVICGANANGHYWRQFLSGQFSQRKLLVLESETGKQLWTKNANYRIRPLVLENEIFAEPFAFDLHTGAEKKREHPLTGEQTAWQFSRPGHHCGMITATPNMLFFRSGFTGYYDLYSDSGTSHFAGHRLGCWVNAIPGNGLLMIPEASAGCVCQFSIASTIVMEPRTDRDTWRIYSATGSSTPVKKMSVNLGAPGDRKDEFGTLWLSYPRPKLVGRLEYAFKLNPQFADGGAFFSYNEESKQIGQADTAWIHTSGAQGLKRIEIPLVGENDAPADYDVKLYFSELEDTSAGSRKFNVKLQGTVVAPQLDVVREAGGVGRALVKEFKGVPVEQTLIVELQSQTDLPTILSAIEVERQ